MSKTITKPNDIRWPGLDGLPRSFEDINANFDALFRALELAGISPAGVISPPGPTGGGGTGTPAGLSDPVTEPHGGTGKTTFSKGDVLVGKADHKLDKLAIGTAGKVLTSASGTPAWEDPAHAVLSARHSDATVGTVVRGDVITGQGAPPTWKRLAKGAENTVLKMGANDPAWTDPAHKALSATHSDTTAADAVRGDVIAAKGVTPKWERVAKGAAGDVLTMGADEPGWAAPAGADHDLLSATHLDTTAASPTRGDIISAVGISPKWERVAKGTLAQVLTMGADEPGWADAAGGAEVDPQFALTKRYGFVDNAETTIALAAVGDGTYEFTLGSVGATFRYFRNGVLCEITGDQTVLLAGTNPPDDGQHFIYFDSEDGTLIDGGAWTLLDTKVPVALVIWQAAMTPTYWLIDERHTCLIDRRIHYYEHTTEGTRLLSGGTLSGLSVDGATDAANTFGIDDVSLADEDLLWDLDPLVDPEGLSADYVIFYRTGASTWGWKSSIVPYDYAAAGYIKWDSAGTQTEGNATPPKYYNYYLCLTNIDGAARYMLVPGRAAFGTLAAAKAEDIGAFTFTGLPVQEFVIAYRMTWLTGSGYANTGKCRLAATPQAISISGVTAVVGGASTDHNTLANLQGGDTTERYHLTALQEGGEWVSLGAGAAVESGSKLKIAGHAYIVQYDAGAGGAAKTIDWQNGNEQILELTADCTLTFSNPKAGARYVIRFAQDGTGGWVVTWPGTVVWSGGIEPVLESDPSSLSLVAFYYDGTNYVGAGANASAAAQGMPEVPLAVLHGGTGQSAIVDGQLFAGDDAGGMSVVPAPTADGQVLTAKTTINRKMEWSSSPLSRATCGVYLGTDTVASDGVEVPIEFDGTSWDDFDMHDPLSNPERVTIPTGYGGVYVVVAGIGWEGYVAIGGEYYTRIYVNGVLVRECANAFTYMFGAQPVAGSNLSAIIELAVGDYVELKCFMAVGQTVAIYGGAFRTYLHLAQVS